MTEPKCLTTARPNQIQRLLQLAANDNPSIPSECSSLIELRCLIPDFDGAFLSHESKDALWDRFYTAAPQRRRQSVERYKIVKRA
jgi:hypothetical protein